MDAWVFLGWFACNLLLTISSWRFARILFPNDSTFPTLMHTVVLAWAQIVGVTYLLGIIEVLSGCTLMSAMAVNAAIVLALCTVKQPPSVSQWFPSDYEPGWRWFWFGVIALWIAHSITSGLLRFPIDWDTLHYHLPLIAHWLQAGSLYNPDNSLWSNPGNNEILGFWMVAPFSGDFMIALNNLPVSILLACATIEVGRQIGLSSSLAHLTAFAVVSNYVVLNQLLDASNDVAVTAPFLACIAYGFRLTKTRTGRVSPDFFLFSVALGLLAGVKFYALGYAALLGTTFFFLSWKRLGWQLAFRFSALGLVGLFLWGGYWYLRNTWVAGSPLYPKTFSPETEVITKTYPDLAHTSFLGNHRPELFVLSVKAIWHMTGPCHVVAFLIFPFTIAWMLISSWGQMRKRDISAADIRWTTAALIAGSCSIILITPFAVEDDPGSLNQMHMHYCPVRYGLSFLSISVLGLAFLLQDIFSRKAMLTWLPGLFLFLSGVFQTVFPDSRLPLARTELFIIAGNLLLFAGNTFLLATLWPRLGRISLLIASVAFLAGGAWLIDWRASRWHRDFPVFYDSMYSSKTFSFLSKEEPNGKICVLIHRGYPIFGSHRRIRVCQPMYVPSAAWLKAYLMDQDARFVVARSGRHAGGWHGFHCFQECLRDDPAAFQRLTHDTNDLIIFRVVKPLPQHGPPAATNIKNH